MQQFAGAGDGFAGEPCGKLRRQAGRDTGAREFFGEQEHIGRTGAGDRGHRVHQAFIVDPFHRARGAQQRICGGALRGADILRGAATVMPRPIAAGVFGMARTTLPPQTSSSAAIVVPAMIETTSVFGPMNFFNAGPASRNICGFTATTSVRPCRCLFGLRRMPWRRAR